MEPSRLQEIIEPLEILLEGHYFVRDDELVEDSIRMASFVRDDGKRVDYTLDVRHDFCNRWGGWAAYDLMVSFYNAGDLVKSWKQSPETSVPITTLVNDAVQEKVKPYLMEHLV
jgi:hypothetical protein